MPWEIEEIAIYREYFKRRLQKYKFAAVNREIGVAVPFVTYEDADRYIKQLVTVKPWYTPTDR